MCVCFLSCAGMLNLLCLPSVHRGGDMLVYLCAIRSVCLSLCVCVSHLFLFSAFCRAGAQTPDVDPMLG